MAQNFRRTQTKHMKAKKGHAWMDKTGEGIKWTAFG